MKPPFLFFFLVFFLFINENSFSQDSKKEKLNCVCTKEQALKKGEQLAKRRMFWKHLTQKYEYKIEESYIYHPKGYWRITVFPKTRMHDGGVCIILSKYCKLFKWIERC